MSRIKRDNEPNVRTVLHRVSEYVPSDVVPPSNDALTVKPLRRASEVPKSYVTVSGDLLIEMTAQVPCL